MSFAIALLAALLLCSPAVGASISWGRASIEAAAGNPCPTGNWFQQGEQVRLSGSGFAGGGSVSIPFRSADFVAELGPTNADGAGDIDTVVTLPQGFATPTLALIKLNGPAPSGRRSLRLQISIGPSTTSDGDGDGVPDYCDNCPTIGNSGQENSDRDEFGDVCDSCPLDFENDFDGDGLCSGDDPCPGHPNNDADGDEICENFDNCPDIANPGQADTDLNGIGDACQVNPTCSDGVDNDRDGLTDFGSDPGCASATDTTETDASLPCDDGIDNDGDVTIDTSSGGVGDPGCLDATSPREDPECDDGIDNDGDGKVDFDGDYLLYPSDEGCGGFGYAVSEAGPVCGNGTVDPMALNQIDGEEQCDDGNTADGDGCDRFCRTECPPNIISIPGCGDVSDPYTAQGTALSLFCPGLCAGFVSRTCDGSASWVGISDTCEPDSDSDFVADDEDNCTEFPNPNQDDTDGDFCGNVCDADYDQDGVVGWSDFGTFGAVMNTISPDHKLTEPIGDMVGFGDFGQFGKLYNLPPGPSGIPRPGDPSCP